MAAGAFSESPTLAHAARHRILLDIFLAERPLPKKQVHSHHTKDTRSFLPSLGFDPAGLVSFDSHSVMSFWLSTSLTADRHKLCLLPQARLYSETLQLNNKSTYSIAKEAETPGDRICLCFRKRESPKLTQTS